ncbi:hypothetical protein Daura_03145 [Dactylosporangium aurantiacum]|uniref:PIN domain-containing protein n=1 Tax=Dactylosporangium aurantiacum TaxID=35754 RepID=A0A9Q9ILT4_9ACTN|nr:hypothetical protein [Dactylosporangium aurantiacum]MDG6100641.1 hypothetical protein [Dactylosporangium aurantiacum]UWZ55275.1 hypothetical protein Daura_03145 [Dactylosporangium aurantiacum]
MFVLDASAIVALFDSYDPVLELWSHADCDELLLAFPVAAMIEAGERAEISATAWDPLLWSTSMRVLPIGEVAAKHLGTQIGSLAARHAVWESAATGWPVLTCEPDLYGAGVHVHAI